VAPVSELRDLSLGVEEIDAQHRELFVRAGRLREAIRANDRAQVEPLVAFLGEYVLFHFEAEERLMRQRGYPGLEVHRAAHERFRNEFAALAADFSERGATALVALTLHNWVAEWVRLHVGGLDLDLARWLRESAAGDVAAEPPPRGVQA
jgi:hemerythrin